MSLPPASTGESYPANGSRKVPFFFREENSNLIVKGNFMTLSAKPEYVEKGEWLAHQGKSTDLFPLGCTTNAGRTSR